MPSNPFGIQCLLKQLVQCSDTGRRFCYSTTWVALGIVSVAAGNAVQVAGIAEQAGDIGERVAGILVE